jgi:hypothetical protein
MLYTASNYSTTKSQRSPLGWFILAISLLITSQTALAQTPTASGRHATLVRVASRRLSEADSIARVTHRKPDRMRIDKINPAVPHSDLFIVTSSAGAVEQLPTLVSGGGLVALVAAVEQQLTSASVGKDKAGSETSVYATFTISADGQVQQAKIAQGQDATSNAAVLAAIQRLPRLIPGQVAGTAVPVTLTIPVQVKS